MCFTENINFTNNIMSIIPTIFSVFGGGIIGYYISRWSTQDQAFYTASAKLKLAFSEELAMLKRPESKVVHFNIPMQNAFDKHFLAITEFRYFLPKSKRISFDKAWQNYYTHEDSPNDILFIKYTNNYKDKGKEEAIKNIEAILEFTENKFGFYL